MRRFLRPFAVMVAALAAIPSLLAAADPATRPASSPSSAPATKPADKNATWIIDAKPTPDTLRPGDTVTLNVTVRNNTDGDLVIDIPSFWWAHSDNAAIVFPSWPRRAGLGPVVIFKPLTLAAGETYTRTWTATVSPDAPAGDCTFHMGIPLQRQHRDTNYWSTDIKIRIENP